jgi:hypothetical protein
MVNGPDGDGAPVPQQGVHPEPWMGIPDEAGGPVHEERPGPQPEHPGREHPAPSEAGLFVFT